MKTQKAVAQRISELLNQNHMTPYELSIKSGLTKQAISNILNEKYKTIKFDTLIKLSDGFGMTFHEFTTGKMFDRNNLDVE